jgi:hypothetical protein
MIRNPPHVTPYSVQRDDKAELELCPFCMKELGADAWERGKSSMHRMCRQEHMLAVFRTGLFNALDRIKALEDENATYRKLKVFPHAA